MITFRVHFSIKECSLIRQQGAVLHWSRHTHLTDEKKYMLTFKHFRAGDLTDGNMIMETSE